MGGRRQSNPIDLAVQPGLFMQRSSRQSQARYTAGDNVRWYRGLPQKMGGYVEQFLTDTNGNPAWYVGHVRSMHQWDSLDGQNWIAFGTEYKLYLINNGRLYDITPIRRTAVIGLVGRYAPQVSCGHSSVSGYNGYQNFPPALGFDSYGLISGNVIIGVGTICQCQTDTATATFQVCIQGLNGVLPANGVFTSLSFTDANGVAFTLNASAATYSANNPAAGYALWQWSALSPAPSFPDGFNLIVTFAGFPTGGGFATVAGSLVVTVSDIGHGAQTGDFVTFSQASSIGNVNPNREWQIASIIDLDTYTVQLDVPASLTASGGGGSVVASYDWPSGLTSDGTLGGYGTGEYGMEAYGTARTLSTFGGQARIWSLDNWGEDLLASPNGEALFWWQRSTGADSRAILRPNAPPNMERMLVGPDDRHVIALGANVDNSTLTAPNGTQDKMFVRWCAGDDFDDWIEQTTNDAGAKRLDTGSRLVTACKTRTSVLLFTDEALYSVSLVGGTDVYDIQPMGSAVKIISPGAAVDVGGIIFFMGQQSFYYFDGTLHDLPCDVADYVFGPPSAPRMNRQMQSKVTANVRKDYTEIRWHFPSTDGDENDSTVIYNWTMQCWYVSTYRGGRECGLDTNVAYGVPVSLGDGAFRLEETGFDAGTEEPIFNYLTTWEGELQMTSRLDSGQTLMLWAASGGANLLLLHTLIPDFKELSNSAGASSGAVMMQCFGRNQTGDATVYGDQMAVTNTTEQIDPQFCQRRVGMYMENYTFGDFWRMDVWRGLATPYGRS